MKYQKSSGLLFIVYILGLSFLNAWGNWGDIIEKLLSFLVTLSLFFVAIALFEIWRGKVSLSTTELKTIAISFPIITLAENIYPLIKYIDQKRDSGWLLTLSMDFTISLFVFYIIWSNLKKCQ